MLTIQTLLSNITKGQSAIPTRLIFAQLNSVYIQLKPKIRILKAEISGKGTLVYMVVPSQGNDKIYYDIDFWFDSQTRITMSTNFKVFSNSPAFGYSYAYLFHQQGSLLFPEKYPKIMITQPPNVRNPFATMAFDKHVYSALAFIQKENLAAIIQQSHDKDIDVMGFEDKMEELKKKK